MNWFVTLLVKFDNFCEWCAIQYNTRNMEPTPPEQPNHLPADLLNPDALLPWTSIENNRHNVRALCDLAGLTEEEKNKISQVIHCESNYNPACVHPNIVNGIVSSTDFGIAQINDFWHIGPGKDFETSQYVLDNPKECIEWMIKQFKAGNLRLWVCYNKSLYENYSS